MKSENKKKTFIFKGEEYSSYYQLEKVMNISRRTIQYRHEVKGIPIDEVPNFVPAPLKERFGEKVYFPNALNKEGANVLQDELQRIVDYPKEPSLYIGDDALREKKSREEYSKWLKDAPDTLVKRELKIYEEELSRLINEEKGKYFYVTTLHEEKKTLLEQRISIIKQTIE